MYGETFYGRHTVSNLDWNRIRQVELLLSVSNVNWQPVADSFNLSVSNRQPSTSRSVPKVRDLPSKLSFLLSDFHEIPQNVTLMPNELFGLFYKAK